jgi:hypothetical protein
MFEEKYKRVLASLKREKDVIQAMQKILGDTLIELQLEESQLDAIRKGQPWDATQWTEHSRHRQRERPAILTDNEFHQDAAIDNLLLDPFFMEPGQEREERQGVSMEGIDGWDAMDFDEDLDVLFRT